MVLFKFQIQLIFYNFQQQFIERMKRVKSSQPNRLNYKMRQQGSMIRQSYRNSKDSWLKNSIRDKTKLTNAKQESDCYKKQEVFNLSKIKTNNEDTTVKNNNTNTFSIINAQLEKYYGANKVQNGDEFIADHHRLQKKVPNSTTSLLYSKFIVKGFKHDKVNLVRNTLRKDKTPKNSIWIIDNQSQSQVKIKKTNTNNFFNSNVQPNPINHQIRPQSSKTTSNLNIIGGRSQSGISRPVLPQFYKQEQTNNLNYQISKYFKTHQNQINTQNKHSENQNQNQNQEFIKSQIKNSMHEQYQAQILFSQNHIFQRPKSAYNSNQKIPKYRPLTAKVKSVTKFEQNKSGKIKNEPKIWQTNFEKTPEYDEKQIHLESGNIIRVSESSKLLSKNHIEINKRQASSRSKKSSFYLTGVGKIREKQQQKQQNYEGKKEVDVIKEDQQFSQLNKVFQIERLKNIQQQRQIVNKVAKISLKNSISTKQVANYTQVHKQNMKHLIKYMPQMYEDYLQFLNLYENQKEDEIRQRQIKLMTIQQQTKYELMPVKQSKGKELLSKGLCDEQIEQRQDKVIGKNDLQLIQAHQAMHQHVQKCQYVSYLVNKLQQNKNVLMENTNILSSDECQEILRMYKQKNLNNDKVNHIKLKEIKQQEKDSFKVYLLKKLQRLQFFKNRKPDENQSLLQLPYTIQRYQPNTKIIQLGQFITWMYIIIDGTITKISSSRPNNILTDVSASPTSTPPLLYRQSIDQSTNAKPNYQNLLQNPKIKQTPPIEISLFQGESFGQPQFPSQIQHTYTFITASSAILMKIPFYQYRENTKQLNNLDDKLSLAKKIFNNLQDRLLNPQIKIFSTQELQMVAVLMEEEKYVSKVIVGRVGDNDPRFIIVAKGQVDVVEEEILLQEKQVSKDLKFRPKGNHQCYSDFKKYETSVPQLSDHRRKNIINYQILKENEFRTYFYTYHKKQTLIKGDCFNWKALNYNLSQSLTASAISNKIFNPLRNSLISQLDQTIILSLNIRKIQQLPDYIRESIFLLAESKVKEHSQIEIKKKLRVKTVNKDKKIEQNYEKLADESKIVDINAKGWRQYKTKLCKEIVQRKKSSKKTR